MKQIVILLFLLTVNFSFGEIRLTFYDIENKTTGAYYKDALKTLNSELERQNAVVIPQGTVENIIKSKADLFSGMDEFRKFRRASAIAGADFVLMGTFNFTDEKFSFNLNAVHTLSDSESYADEVYTYDVWSKAGLNAAVKALAERVTDKIKGESVPVYIEIRDYRSEHRQAIPEKKSEESKPEATVPAYKTTGGSDFHWLGYLLIGIGAGSGVLGYVFDLQANSDFASATNHYSNSTNSSYSSSDQNTQYQAYQSKIADSKQDINYRNALYITGGVSAGLGLIICFIPSSPAQHVQFFVQPNYFCVLYRF